ncbi:MAG: Lrp/AsnC family transcriptional regulator [Candidatus Odinarchaeota archaeon]
MSPTRIDETDKKLLTLLSLNSRMSFRKIAQRSGVSESTVRKRVEHLKKIGVIRSFTITIDPNVLNKKVAAFITIKPKLSSKDDVARELLNTEAITEMYVLNIQCGYIVKAEVESLEALHELVEKLRENDSIETFEPCIVLRASKQQAFQFGSEVLEELDIDDELVDT